MTNMYRIPERADGLEAGDEALPIRFADQDRGNVHESDPDGIPK